VARMAAMHPKNMTGKFIFACNFLELF
jgi:hypothetical protein